jgi:hypothetical protein
LLYCSGVNGLILPAIRYARKGEPWDGVEVLTGKRMKPTPGLFMSRYDGKSEFDEAFFNMK